MTHAEFWQSEAEHEGQGREPWELMSDFYQELEDDTERCRQEMLRDTEEAYQTILKYWMFCREDIDWTETDPFCDWREGDETDFFILYKPRRVIEVLHAELRQNFRDTSYAIVARVLFSGGRIRLVRHSGWYDYGTMLDPPDSEEEVAILSDDWEPEDA